MTKKRSLLVVVLCTWMCGAGVVYAANFVTLKAWASEEYLKERARNPDQRIQTYQFLEGHHWKGRSVDNSVEAFNFVELANDLAGQLSFQNFYPNPIKGEGDLLIVVHYGVTDHEDDVMDMMGINNELDLGGVGLIDSINSLAAFQSAEDNINSTARMTRSLKAQILGINDVRMLPSHLKGKYEYGQMLEEPRYFVVIMAYDYQRFMKQGETVLLWSTRYNIRTAGQNFEAAIKDMNLVASGYFGKNFDKLTRKRSDDKSAVEIGEIEVIEN